MKIFSANEYDPLKSVVVGSATNAYFPAMDKVFQYGMRKGSWTESSPPVGHAPKYVIEETNEDLEVLSQTLRELDITVYRPDDVDFSYMVRTTDWATEGQYAYCPRDNLLVIGDMVIETPMSTRGRQHEVIAFDTIRRQAIKDGARWIAAPRPRLLDEENMLHRRKFELNNEEPVFDAANICRFGMNLLYLISDSGNELGARWLQNVLGKDFTVHTTDVYDAAHIDSTILSVDYNTIVVNANRVNANNLPECLQDYKKIYVTEDLIIPQDFHEYPYASKWIAINMLAIGPGKVIVEKSQYKLIEFLEKVGLEVIPSPLRHARTLGGGFHCVTLDLEREFK